ncbi:MAG: hypothetical protein AB7R40_23400 [Nitrospiraceae bacterium]
MKGGEKQTTQTTTLDPASQQYVDRTRGRAESAYQNIMNAGPLFIGPDPRTIEEQIQPFINPYQSQVVDATRAEFDNLRGQARRGVSDAALKLGVYDSGRHGVAQGVREGELDRAQASTIAGLLQGGYESALDRGLGYSEYQRALRERVAQEPIFRGQQGLNFLNLGMGPTGQSSTVTEKQDSDLWGTIAGLGTTALSFWNPFAGAAASGALNLAGGKPGTPGSLGWRPFEIQPKHPVTY